MKAPLLRPQRASINVSASPRQPPAPLARESGGVRPGPRPPPEVPPAGPAPHKHPSVRHGAQGRGPGEGRRLVTPQTGHFGHPSPHPGLPMALSLSPRAPSSSERELQVSWRGDGKQPWLISTTASPSKSPPQLISVPPWMQAPASPVEGRHGREDPWLSSWGSSPEQCPKHPVSLDTQPACFGFKS